MSTRDLRVRFIGDAGSLKGAFQEVDAAAASSQASLQRTDFSTGAVGKSFIKTGKALKATGKLFKSSGQDAAAAGASFLSCIPALSGVTGAAGTVITALSSLGNLVTGLSGRGIALLATAAIGGAIAFALLRHRVSFATITLREMEAENKRVAESHREVALATLRSRDALNALRGQILTVKEGSIQLVRAHQAVSDAAKNSGKGSLDYREALLQLQRAQLDSKAQQADLIHQAQAAIRHAKDSSAAIDKETAATHRAADAARQRLYGFRQGFFYGGDAVKLSHEMDKALTAEASAANKAAARHRENAVRAREMAKAVGTGTEAARTLHDKLIELSNTELSLSSVISAMRNLSAAAGGAAGAVSHVYDLLRNPPASPTVTVRAAGPGGAPAGAAKKMSHELSARGGLTWGLAAVPVGSPIDLNRARGAADRSETSARLGAEDEARGRGATEAQIKSAGQRAADNARKAALQGIARRILTRRSSLLKQVKRYDITARMRIKVPRAPKDAVTRALQQRAQMKQSERAIRDELESLATDYADAQVQLRSLDADLADLSRQDEAEAAAIADQAQQDAAAAAQRSEEAQRAGLDRAVAEAALTPGLGDDLAAAKAVEAAAQAKYEAARASGNDRAIADTAAALLGARTNREQIEATMKNTDAINANTAAVQQSFGGSTVVSYRGQDFVLGSLAPPSSDDLRMLAI